MHFFKICFLIGREVFKGEHFTPLPPDIKYWIETEIECEWICDHCGTHMEIHPTLETECFVCGATGNQNNNRRKGNIIDRVKEILEEKERERLAIIEDQKLFAKALMENIRGNQKKDEETPTPQNYNMIKLDETKIPDKKLSS